MKRSITVLLVAFIVMSAMAGCVSGERTASQPASTQPVQTADAPVTESAAPAATEAKEPIIIRLAHEDPPDNQWGMGATHFKELVEQKTNGEVVIMFCLSL